MRRPGCAAALACACASLPFAAAAAAEAPALFSAAAPALFSAAASSRAPSGFPRAAGRRGLPPAAAERQFRMARTDLRALAAARSAVEAGGAAQLTFNLFADARLAAVLERSAPTPRGYSLSGRIEGAEESAVTLVANGDVLYGTVWTLGASYEIRTVGGAQAIERVEPPSWRCEGAGRAGHAADLPAPAAERGAPASRRAAQEGGDDGSVVDVMLFYLPEARRQVGGHRRTLAMLDHHVAWINAAYARSGVAMRLELAGAVEVDYAHSKDYSTDRSRFSEPDDGHMDEVYVLWESYAADLIALAAPGVGGGLCCPPIWGIGSASSLAHELGHDMWLGHERQDFGVGGRRPYSHGYWLRASSAHRDTHCTIMCGGATAGRPLPRFSNPRQRFRGHPLGVPGEEPTDDVDGPADAARSLNETRRKVAGRRQSATRCGYRLSPEVVEIPAAGGAVEVRMEADAGCAWTARAVEGLATIESGSAGTGSGTVRYRVAANAGWEREVALAVAGEMHVGVQAGGRPVKPVCERSAAVRDALAAETGLPCGEVGASELASVPSMELGGYYDRETRWFYVKEAMPAPVPGDLDGLSNLGKLRMWIRPGDTLPAGVFDGLDSLEDLRLYNADFAVDEQRGVLRSGGTPPPPVALEDGVFDGMPNLGGLGLVGFEGIRPGIFRGLSRADSLVIDRSDLSELQPGAFDGLSDLRKLFLTKVAGLSLPAGAFDGLHELVELYMEGFYPPDRGVSLGAFEPGAFDDLRKLRSLTFLKIGMPELRPGVFRGLSSRLYRLKLSSAGLTRLPAGVFDDLAGLIRLELSNYRSSYSHEIVRPNEFPTLPAGLFHGLPLLGFLELADVGLEELDPEWFEDLSAVRHLDLHGNRLSVLPAGLLHATPKLEVLELSGNRLRSLPADAFVGFARGLRSLSLHGNPGSPFALEVDLMRVPPAGSAGAAAMALHLPRGAPRLLEFGVSASGGRVRRGRVRILSGEARSRPFEVAPDGDGPVVVSAELLTSLAQGSCDEDDTYLMAFRGRCYTGIGVVVGEPLVLNGVRDRELAVGEGSWRIELADVFLGFDVAATSYAAESSDPAVAVARVEGGRLWVAPRAEGSATVRIVATAADGRSAIRTFSVTVPARGRPFLRGWRLSLLEARGPPP